MDTENKTADLSTSRCPGCGLPLEDWPNRGVLHAGFQYCCGDCAEGYKCSCADKHLGAVSA